MISIRELDESGTIVFQTAAPSDNTDKITGAFFDISSFQKNENSNWITNYSAGRKGGFKHYNGQEDSSMPVLLHLTGTSRFSLLQTWKGLAGGTIIHLTHDTDSNLNGKYVILSLVPRYLERQEGGISRIELMMNWESNNTS